MICHILKEQYSLKELKNLFFFVSQLDTDKLVKNYVSVKLIHVIQVP